MADWQTLYPFKSNFLTAAPPVLGTSAGNAQVPTPRLHYLDEGSGTNTLLCVHGNPTWSFTYREVLLQQRTSARVIAVDHMGCGLSDKPAIYPYCLDQHIANLSALIEHLDLRRVTLVVHDWGGAIGLGAALRAPERISGLVLLNTAAFPPPYVPLRIAACRIPILGEWAMRGLNLFARAALHMTLHRLSSLPPAVASGLIAPYDSWAHRVAIARFVQDIPSRPSQPTWQRLESIERGLAEFRRLPVEIVWGMHDWCFRPECLDRLHRALPQAQVTRLDDVGHYVMEEASQEVNQAITRCVGNQR